MLLFSGYRESFSPETLDVLEAAFNAAWGAVVASGVECDQQATRTALADAIVYFASEGETDQRARSGGPSEGALPINATGRGRRVSRNTRSYRGLNRRVNGCRI
jgi:hypothetical protein